MLNMPKKLTNRHRPEDATDGLYIHSRNLHDGQHLGVYNVVIRYLTWES